MSLILLHRRNPYLFTYHAQRHAFRIIHSLERRCAIFSSKPKPKPSKAQAKLKPSQAQAKPKPSSSQAQAQAKPKPSSSQAKPKPSPSQAQVKLRQTSLTSVRALVVASTGALNPTLDI